MGWFDEQLRERENADNAVFEDSFQAIAGAIMGQRMSQALNDDRQMTTDAIGEILKYYHIKPQEVPESIKDMNEVLEYLMRPSGIMRRSVKLEKGWYKDAVGAMLGTRKDDGSVVALLPFGLTGYRFYDRKIGKYVRVNAKNQEMIEEEAFAFYKPFPLKKMSVGSLMRYILEQIAPADLAMLGASMAAATGIGMILPRLNALLFSDVLASGSVRMLLGIAIYMVCASLSALVIGVVKGFVTARINTKLNLSVEAASMMRVLTLPVAFFKQYNTGELSSRVSYMNPLANQLVNMALSTGLTSLFSLAYISQIFIYAPALVVPALLMTLLTVAVTTATMLLQVSVSKRQMKLAAKESGITHALITGIQKIRLAGAEKRMFARWGTAYSESAALSYNPPIFLKMSGVISMAISLIGTMVLYYAAVNSGVSVSQYYAFNSAYGMLSGAFMAIAEIALSFSRIKPIMEMAKPILDAVPEVSEGKQIVTGVSGNISIENLTFRYDENHKKENGNQHQRKRLELFHYQRREKN